MKFSHTLTTNAKPAQIWIIWTNVDQWHLWDTELTAASLNERFALHATGKLIPKTGASSTFRITELTPNTSYTFTTQLPLCLLNVRRYLTVTEEKTAFTHEVWFTGVLSVVFSFLLGKTFQAALPQVMENLRHLAETQEGEIAGVQQIGRSSDREST